MKSLSDGVFRLCWIHGFRFYRYHTHVPTEEEMAVADEMGMLLDVEFGLISNFNKTTPFEEGVEMLECYGSARHGDIRR